MNSKLRDLYQEVIVDHSKRPRNFRKLEGTVRSAEGFNPLCGDKVTVYVNLEDGVPRDRSFLWFHGIERASLGRGRQIEAYLSGGVHVITLVAFDSAGNTVEKRFVLRVGQRQSDM